MLLNMSSSSLPFGSGAEFFSSGGTADGPELDLVAAPGARLRDLSDKLLAPQVLQLDAWALVEVGAKTSFEDTPSLGALLDLARDLVSVGVVHEGVAVVLPTNDL